MSKVMPLPTSTTCGVLAGACGGRVVEPDQPRRGRRGLADGEDAAEAVARRARFSSQTVTSRPASLGDLVGLVGQPVRGSSGWTGTVASIRDRQPAPPTATARRAHRRRRSSGSRRARPGATGCVLGRRSSASGSRTSRASRPTTNASRPRRRARSPATDVATLARSPRRRGPAPRRPGGSRSARCVADADQQHQRSVGVVAAPSGTGSDATSPALPVARRARATASRSSAERVGELVGARAEQRRVAVGRAGSTGRATTSTPRIGVRAAAALSANSGGETWRGECWGCVRDGHDVSRRRP